MTDDPAIEFEVAQDIAMQFTYMGVRNLTVIANKQHLNYIDGEAYNATPSDLFATDPRAPIDVFVVAHPTVTLN